MDMRKIIDWTLYLIGLVVITSFLHELYHYSFCGGEFIAGLGYIKGKVVTGGYTWCAGSNYGGEIIPSVGEILLIIAGVYLKGRG